MNPYDIAALKERTDLGELAARYTALRKVTANEQAGPCPKCGGKDRFHLNAAEGWFFCRQCHPQRGDVIELVRWLEGASFVEACERLGAQTIPQGAPRRKPSPSVAYTRPPVEAIAPGDTWQAKARAFVRWAESQLWQDPAALAYLRDRGLTDDTIRGAQLGYSPKSWLMDPGEWGQVPNDPGDRMIIPRGWVIPCEAGGQLWYVKIRRRAEDLQGDRPKYHAIRGSQKRGAIYGLDALAGHTDCVLCEGEFNALILRQALAGIAGVVSVGDAGNRPSAGALAVLGTVKRWVLAFDPDKAGVQGATALADEYRRATIAALPWADRGAKYDLNDAAGDGEDLAAWLIPQLGPLVDPDKRARWLEYHAKRLDSAAFDAGANEADPALRVWLALYGELCALRGWATDDAPMASVGETAMQVAPSAGEKGFPVGADLALADGWPGPGWEECAAPDWAWPENPGYPRRWARSLDGQHWKSLS